MSKFKVGDIIARPGGVRLCEVTASFEDFCQARSFDKLSGTGSRTILTIDELVSDYVKIDMPPRKFNIKDRVLYLYLDERAGYALTLGTIIGYTAEIHRRQGVSKPIYYYSIKPDEPSDTNGWLLDGIAEERDIHNIVNTSALWNDINDA